MGSRSPSLLDLPSRPMLSLCFEDLDLVLIFDGSANWCDLGVPRDVLFNDAALRPPQRLFFLSFTGFHGDNFLWIQGDWVCEVSFRDPYDDILCSNFHVDHSRHLLNWHLGWSTFRPLLLDLEWENLLGLGLWVVPPTFSPETPHVLIQVWKVSGAY